VNGVKEEGAFTHLSGWRFLFRGSITWFEGIPTKAQLLQFDVHFLTCPIVMSEIATPFQAARVQTVRGVRQSGIIELIKIRVRLSGWGFRTGSKRSEGLPITKWSGSRRGPR